MGQDMNPATGRWYDTLTRGPVYEIRLAGPGARAERTAWRYRLGQAVDLARMALAFGCAVEMYAHEFGRQPVRLPAPPVNEFRMGE